MIKKLMMLSVVSGMICTAWAETETVGAYTWTYSITGDTAKIYAISPSPTGVVTIPSMLGGKPVTSIGESAFFFCSGLTSVAIPNSVTNIGEGAFCGCSGLMAISVGPGNANYKSVNGLLLSKDGKTLIQGVNGDVVVPNGVTSIGYCAFSGCSGLTSVTIPDSVTSIENDAFAGSFYGCSGLTSVTIPQYVCTSRLSSVFPSSYQTITNVVITDSVTNIGDYAFYDCSGLTSVTIGDGVTNIGDYAFSGCSRLTSVTMGDSVTSIGSSAFYNCSGLTSVTMGDSVTSIGSSAFYNCSGLTSVTIGDSVTSIGSSAFYGCSGLTSVTIPQYVCTSRLSSVFPSSYQTITNVVVTDGVTNIGNSAFSGCSRLTSVTIGDGVTSIGGRAFEDCSGLTSVHVTDLAKWCGISFGGSTANPLFYAKNLYLNGELLTELTIPDSVTSIGSYAFYNCSGLTSVTIPDSVTSIESSAFYNCNGLTSVHVTDLAKWCGISFGGSTANPLFYAKNLYLNGELLTELTIPDSVTSIGSCAFYNCSGLTSVTIPDSVTSIGDDAFSFCEGLTSVTIGNGVTSIGDCAFGGCSGLTSVTIPDSVTSIGDEAFWGCSGLADSEGFVIVRNVLYGYYGGGGDVTIPDSVTSIEYDAFSGCSSLTSVTIPDSVTSIGDDAFSFCEGLTSVTIGNGVTSIGDCAFGRCSGLTSVTIPDSVTSIGDYAFDGCWGLTSVTIGNGVTSIGVGAFRECEDLLDTMTIPGVGLVDGWVVGTVERPSGHLDLTGIRGIGSYAFMYCHSLESVIIGKGVTRVAEHAFIGCDGLTSVTIPDSVTDIGDYAFRYCGLTNVTIPNSVTSIGEYAFWGLRNVIFNGNAPEVGDSAFDDDPDITVYVRRGSTGWGVDIPGTWQGMRIEYLDVVEVNGAAVEFAAAEDGKTRTAEVAAGTAAEDVKVFVGGVDVTAGFSVAVEGTTATVVLREPFERTGDAAVSSKPPYQENDDGKTVTLNVAVVPGLYYAADSAGTIEALKRPGAVGPAKAGDVVVAPKQMGEQGFYKVWVSDAPIEAE